jgi:hypothetical protein
MTDVILIHDWRHSHWSATPFSFRGDALDPLRKAELELKPCPALSYRKESKRTLPLSNPQEKRFFERSFRGIYLFAVVSVALEEIDALKLRLDASFRSGN